MTKFSEYEFGLSDALDEYRTKPDIFDFAYYDLDSGVDKVLTRKSWLVVGRKGSGKTALAAKILRMAIKSKSFFASITSLENLWSMHDRFNRNANDEDSLKATSTWKALIALQLFDRMLIDQPQFRSDKEVIKLSQSLQRHGLLHGTSDTITRIVSSNEGGFKIKLSAADIVSLQLGGDRNSIIEVTGPNAIYNVVLNVIEKKTGSLRQTILIVDGMDPFLVLKSPPFETVTALVLATRDLNRDLHFKRIGASVVVLMRTEVMNRIYHPDRSKMLQDGGIRLTWYTDTRDPMNSDLMKMLRIRIGISDKDLGKNENAWFKLFPERISSRKDSWEFVKENTQLRPRDLLYFMREVKKRFPERASLNRTEMLTVMNNYSTEYFLPELTDSLVGFLYREQLDVLQKVLRKIGTNEFGMNHFEKLLAPFAIFRGVSPTEILDLLFQCGFIKQVDEESRFISAVAYDDMAQLDPDASFLLHDGLHKALNLK